MKGLIQSVCFSSIVPVPNYSVSLCRTGNDRSLKVLFFHRQLFLQYAIRGLNSFPHCSFKSPVVQVQDLGPRLYVIQSVPRQDQGLSPMKWSFNGLFYPEQPPQFFLFLSFVHILKQCNQCLDCLSSQMTAPSKPFFYSLKTQCYPVETRTFATYCQCL